VLTDLRNRGIKHVFFLVCDGLKWPPEVASNVWPQAIVQTLRHPDPQHPSDSPRAASGTSSNAT
jgi:hypothetical protein